MRTRVWAALKVEPYHEPAVISLHHAKDTAQAAVATDAIRDGGTIEHWSEEDDDPTYAETWSGGQRYMVTEWEIKP